MDMTQYSGSESSWLKAADFVGKNLKVQISSVEILEFEASEGKPARSRPALKFRDKEKGVCLNATNNEILCNAYGADSSNWISLA